ncbi:N-acetylmuramoyl-L-alanine amidase [Paenibacillus albicereus]|uniref:N-acetylmuramoyl-L-alanine amidase n=1 Tax=Paenibacillus albicereus TaxID=2726185 RepID=A0A6H2H1E7_9BACL|nr:N-acetylmuramoyl-L-alanine amidase [Paenibacillus albicereus]QJC53477.1 N-acetylmuramoyl-L-alanine amidase [Paenibacillus albicereus]
MIRRLTLPLLALLLALPFWSAEAATAAGKSYKVGTNSLAVREDADSGSALKGYLKQGTTVQVTEEKYGWAKLSGGGLKGWAAAHFLVAASGSASSSGSGASVTTASTSKDSGWKSISGSGVRLRSGPGTGYGILGSVTTGDRVKVLKQEGGWTRVTTESGQTAWMSSQYIGGSVAVSSGSGLGPTAGSSRGSLQGKLIAIDPGHGGNDPGMIGTTHGTEEKDLTLSTSQLLAEELRSLGARVVLTRVKDGEKPALAERVRTAAAAAADAFVSVHYNSAKNQASGTLVFYYSKSKDAPLAHAVEERLQGLSLRSNGIAFGDYHVLRENRLPAVLLELGFLSNATDEKETRTASYQKAAARAIAEGLQDYFARKSS